MSQQPAKPRLPLKAHFWGCCLLAVQFVSGAIFIGTLACRSWMEHLLTVNNFSAGSAEFNAVTNILLDIDSSMRCSRLIWLLSIFFSRIPILRESKYAQMFRTINIFIWLSWTLALVYPKILQFFH